MVSSIPSTSNAPTNGVVPEQLKIRVCPGHTRPICHVSFSNIMDDGSFWFVDSGHDSKAMLRHGEWGNWVGTFEGHRGAIYSSSFNEEATRVVTGSGDYTVKLWDAIAGKQLQSWEATHYVKTVDWKFEKIATGGYDSLVRIYNPDKPEVEPLSFKADDNNQMIKSVFLVSGGQLLITAAKNNVKLWDLRNQQVAKECLMDDLRVVDYNGKHHMVLAHGKCVSFIQPETLETVKSIQVDQDVECGSMSHCGKYFAIGSSINMREYLYHEEEQLELFQGHHGPIFHIRYSPDGHWIASGAEDGTVRLWPSTYTNQKYKQQEEAE